MMSRIINPGWFVFILILQVIAVTDTFSKSIARPEQGKNHFFTYCSGCHTLRYAGYKAVGTPPKEAERWFGKTPPDLSNVARVRGNDWLKSFLSGFYPDVHGKFGSNNHQFENVSMPNVLASITSTECREQVVDDIVAYLIDVAEPVRQLRRELGMYVVLFLALFVCGWFMFMRLSKR